MSGRLCSRFALMCAVLPIASMGCDSAPAPSQGTGSSVTADGSPTPEALKNATPPAGKKGGGAPILPGR